MTICGETVQLVDIGCNGVTGVLFFVRKYNLMIYRIFDRTEIVARSVQRILQNNIVINVRV